jgi:hypothetical protein
VAAHPAEVVGPGCQVPVKPLFLLAQALPGQITARLGMLRPHQFRVVALGVEIRSLLAARSVVLRLLARQVVAAAVPKMPLTHIKMALLEVHRVMLLVLPAAQQREH